MKENKKIKFFIDIIICFIAITITDILTEFLGIRGGKILSLNSVFWVLIATVIGLVLQFLVSKIKVVWIKRKKME